MRAFSSRVLAASLTCASLCSGLKILLGNDDGFGSAQIRETYRLLKASGHSVVLVAPVDNESGQGGRSVFTNSPTLYYPSEYNLIPAGAPSLGQDPMDSHIFYYNGTPAACTFVALDYVLPKYFPNFKPDLYVGGPNFGNNLGGFLYTLSGTMGGTYAAIGRNLPGIAFSGGNSAQYSYQQIANSTASGLPDPATIQAQLAVDIVNKLANSTKAGERILPLAWGISINTPYITSLTDKSCVAPKFIQTRMTGGAFTDSAVLVNGTFTYASNEADGVNTVVYPDGNALLPGETTVVHGGCYASASVFVIDYDAPTGLAQFAIRNDQLAPLVRFNNTFKPSKRSLEAPMHARLAGALNAPLRHE